MTDQPQHRPGFYPDPHDDTVERYWDGSKWTDTRQPINRGPAPGEKEQDASGVIITGYVFAVLFPLVGFIIGLTQINKSRHGIWVVVVSVIVFVLWLILIGSIEESNTNDPYSY